VRTRARGTVLSDRTVGHRRLHLNRAADRVNHAGKFQQQAVAGGLDDAGAMVGDCRVDSFLPKSLQRY
jgi:hypothetical protein